MRLWSSYAVAGCSGNSFELRTWPSVITPELRDSVIALAKQAGMAIMEVYGDDFDVTLKGDASPLTQADLRSHDIIVTGLNSLTPKYPVLSEESADIPFTERSQWQTYWLVDPLDGTKEFVSRNGEFTVNIALIHDHAPIFGVVYVPALATLYVGGKGQGAFKQAGNSALVPIKPALPANAPPRVVGSRSHRGELLDAYLVRLGSHELVSMGSSLKFCLIAEGRADLYPRLGPTSEWDTAAAQAVVEGAGGVVCTLDGLPLRYNTKAEILNPHFFVYADRSRDWLAATIG
jgi:3'(2'), 5'-bisphosphate nucleotidase